MSGWKYKPPPAIRCRVLVRGARWVCSSAGCGTGGVLVAGVLYDRQGVGVALAVVDRAPPGGAACAFDEVGKVDPLEHSHGLAADRATEGDDRT